MLNSRRDFLFAAFSTALVLFPVFAFFFLQNLKHANTITFAIEMTSDAGGQLELYHDVGSGFAMETRRHASLKSPETFTTYEFRIPAARYYGWRIDPGQTLGTTEVRRITIVRSDGRTTLEIPLTWIRILNDIQVLEVSSEAAIARATEPTSDPALVVTPPSPMDLTASARHTALRLGLIVCLYIGLIFVGVFLKVLIVRLARIGSIPGPGWVHLSSFNDHPMRTIALVSVVASLLATYPVVLFGRSFVSPTFGTPMLYQLPPFLPGATDTALWNSQGSDVGAHMWQNLPYSFLQHRAVFEHGEAPLWNRFNAAGRPLLGQGLIQIHDPLQWIPVIAGGEAWAWDVKFVLARILFAVGIGFAALAMTNHLPGAMLVAFTAPFLTYFQYRFIHPAQFSIVYAPWIVLAWIGLGRGRLPSQKLLATLALTITTVFQLSAGTPKEGTITLLLAQLTGFLMAMSSQDTFRHKLTCLTLAAMGGLVAVLISAPHWLIFLDTLLGSSADYGGGPAAFTASIRQSIGLFFGIIGGSFDRADPQWIVPGLTPLVLVLFGWAAVRLRTLVREPAFAAAACSGIAGLLVAFGLLSSELLIQLPLINRIYHIDGTFVCASLTPLLLVAAFGARELLKSSQSKDLSINHLLAALTVVAFVVLVYAFDPSDARMYQLKKIALLLFLTVSWSSLVWLFLRASRPYRFPIGYLGVCVLLAIHLPYGLALPSGFSSLDRYLFQPGERTRLSAPSPALEQIRARMPEPYRVTGFEYILMPGVQDIYNLENISGPDPIFSTAYDELIKALGFHRVWVWNVVLRPSDFPAIVPALDMLGVRFLLFDRTTQLPATAPSHVHRAKDLGFIERPTAWPRAFFSDKLRVYDNVDDLVQMIRETPDRPLAAIQRSDSEALKGLKLNESATESIAQGHDYQLTPNTTLFRVKTPGPGVAVLMEAFWSDHHRVAVNGQAQRSVRINHAFIGIPIAAAGEYEIKVTYEPLHWRLVNILSAIGCVVGLAILAIPLFLRRRQPVLFNLPARPEMKYPN